LNVFISHLKKIESEIKEEVNKAIAKNGHIEKNNVPEIISNSVDKHLKYFTNKEDLTSITIEYSDFLILLEKYKIEHEKLFKQEFQKLPLNEQAKDKILKSVFYSIKKNHILNSFSGIVLAGYGESEHFPSVESYVVEGMINRQIKYFKEEKSAKVDLKTRAAIIPFAQSEMVGSFMEGVDPYYQKIVEKMVKTTMDKLSAQLKNKVILDKIHKEFLVVLQNARKKLFSDPITSIVSSLPKDELAEMAESLVNLTSFKRRVSSESETVGGPIDVALITKCDGFVWIKRKHYFKPELNSHFFRNYCMGDCNE
jgi:hypothetical protein